MIILRTKQFDDEARRYALRFTCEHCGHFDAHAEACRHEWPTGEHRLARYQAPLGDPPGEVVFCKEFELA